MNLKRYVEWAANLGIILVCGLFVWTFVTHKTLNFNANAHETDASKLVGFTLPKLQDYRWEQYSSTLILGIRTGCHYCEASMPFYKRLSDLEANRLINAHVLAVMPDGQQEAAEMLQSVGLRVNGIFNEQLNSIKVDLTPTLLLVDQHGRIKKAWIGELTSDKEDEVLNALK